MATSVLAAISHAKIYQVSNSKTYPAELEPGPDLHQCLAYITLLVLGVVCSILARSERKQPVKSSSVGKTIYGDGLYVVA